MIIIYAVCFSLCAHVMWVGRGCLRRKDCYIWLSVPVNMTTASSSDVSPVYLRRCYGRMDVPLTLSAFIIAISLVLQRGNPRFAQLTSSVFGLFYCGYLPSFWVKLRCGLAAPALNTSMSSNSLCTSLLTSLLVTFLYRFIFLFDLQYW